MRNGIERAWLMPAIVLLLVGAVVAIAATTYTAPTPQSSRSDWMTNRYSEPVAGLMVADITTAAVTDGDTTSGTDLSGYLERIVFSHNGDDTAWSLTILDAQGVTLFEKADCNALADPYSYVVSATDADGTAYGGVPFIGGLTVRIANADGGTGTAVTVRCYVTECWRR